MIYILYFIFWLIGLGITSFTLIPILIIFIFGIPTTRMLEKLQLLKIKNGIVRRYSISLVILTTVFIITIIIIFKVYPNGLFGFFFGGGMTFLLGMGSLGKTEGSIEDYIATNKDSFLVLISCKLITEMDKKSIAFSVHSRAVNGSRIWCS